MTGSHDHYFKSHDQLILHYFPSLSRVQGRHEVLPANERSQLRWTGDPYLLDGGGESRELDPGPWLMPYWLARWSRML